MPVGELRSQSDILTALPDGQRELIIRDDHFHVSIRLVDDDLGDNGRRQRVHHELGRIHIPGHNVDLLPAQLLDHILHPGSLHADTGSHRIHVRILGDDGDLGSRPGLAGGADDAHNPFRHLGHLTVEELDQEMRMSPAQDDLRTLADLLHVEHVGADPIPLAINLLGNLLLGRQHRLGLPYVHDHPRFVDPLHDAMDDLALAPPELLVDHFALGIFHLLNDDLLGRLSCDAPQGLGAHADSQLIAQGDFGIEHESLLQRHFLVRIGYGFHHLLELKSLNLAEFLIEGDVQVQLAPVLFLDGGLDGLFKCVDQRLAVNPLFSAHLIDQALELSGHDSSISLRFVPRKTWKLPHEALRRGDSFMNH